MELRHNSLEIATEWRARGPNQLFAMVMAGRNAPTVINQVARVVAGREQRDHQRLCERLLDDAARLV